MKFLLIGATGATGLEIVKQGLAAGHEITALVRDASKVALSDPHLHLVVGDILKPMDVDAAMAGQDAVICSLGTGVTFKHVTLFSDGTQHLLDAMHKHAVRRIVCITGIGAGDSRGHGGFLYDRVIEPTLLRTIYQDKDRQEALLRHSDLDWIIVRPGMLTNDEAIGNYRVLLDLDGITVGKVARADVAAFVLQQLSNDDFLRKTPLLTD
jgi:putative NADH-flavin reductase